MADSQVSGLIEQIKIGSTTHSLASTAYGICDTLAETAAKIVYMTGFNLQKGVTVHIKFTYNNTASSPTLNINNTGAKPIVQYGTTAVANYDSTSGWFAGAVVSFTYDGTSWVRDQGFNTNTTYSYMRPYGSTAGDVATKTGTAGWKFQLSAGKYFMFTQYYDNTAQSALTLNIGGTGAKPIYINGSPSSASNYTLPGGQYLVYYDGTNYHFRTDDKIPGDIAGNATNVTGTVAIANGGTGKTTAAEAWTALGGGSSGKHADSYFIKAITSTDNAIVRFKGTAGQVQDSGITIDNNNNINFPTEHDINFRMNRKTADGGGWAHEYIKWYDNANNVFTRIGIWGTNDEYTYMYIGSASEYNSDLNLRIRADGTIQGKLFSGSGASLTNLNASNISSGTLNLARLGNQNKNLVLAGPTTGDAAAPTFRALIVDDIPDLSSIYLKLDGSNNMTADINIITGDTDKFINFWYNTNKKAGASWRIGELGSGSSDTNYFVIQSGTSNPPDTTWTNALRIGMNTHNIYIPSTTASTSTSTGALTIEGGLGVAGDVYATNLHGNLAVTAHTNTTNGTKNYYPWFSTATSGNLAAKAHSAFYLYETVTDTKISQIDMRIGATNITGSLTLWDGSSHYANIKPTNLSANTTYTLPNIGGTLTVSSGSVGNATTPTYVENGQVKSCTSYNNATVGYITTTEDITNTLYPIGVTSNATTTLKRDTNITMINGTITANTYKITSDATITYNSTSGCVEIIV